MAKVLFCLPTAQSAFKVCGDALSDIGHEVRSFYYRQRAYPELGVAGKIADRIWPADHVARMNAELMEEVGEYNPDILLVFKGEILFPETIRRISRELGVSTAVYYVDSPLWVDNSTLHILNGLQFFDVVFVFEGYYIPELKRLGCRKVEVLPFCCDPAVHTPVELTEEERNEYGSPVCFIGNDQGGYCQREKVLGALLEYGLKIWGTGWGNSGDPAIRAHWTGRPAVGRDMARVYSASGVTFNVTYPHSITQPNMRTFEAPACGILMINDYLEGVQQFFEVGKEIELYRDIPELKRKVEFYLEHPAERRRIAQAGQARAHNDHTYQLRMRKMMDCILERAVK